MSKTHINTKKGLKHVLPPMLDIPYAVFTVNI